MTRDPGGKRRLIDLRSGGAILILAGLLIVAVVAWRGPTVWRLATRDHADFDSDRPNGFDLEFVTVDRERIVGSGSGRNAIPAMVSPEVMTVRETEAFNQEHRGNYLVSDDRVIGVTLGGESRAYPLRVLNWHEIVNDSLGGVPIAVTYHPLCDSVAVFERTVDGRVAEFGVSGLLLDSNQLFYDRTERLGRESLWSQLAGRAISGEDARRGVTLRLLPVSVATWAHWSEARPGTTVLRPADTLRVRYRRNPYGNYLRNGRPRFPLSRRPEGDRPALMDPVLALARPDGFEVYDLRADAFPEALGVTVADAVEVRAPVRDSEAPPSIVVDPDRMPPTVYSLWFAWYAFHPDARPLPPGR
jgi:hypothetical protein